MDQNRIERLYRVKSALGITGSYQDTTLIEYISEVEDYMRYSGVPERVIREPTATGAVVRGVADLWNYGSGGTGFSPYFEQRIVQLRTDALAEEMSGDVDG